MTALVSASVPAAQADSLRLPQIPRYGMVASAMLAPPVTAVGLLLDTGSIGLGGRDMVQHLAAQIDDYAVQSWLAPLAAILWVPAILAIGRVARSGAPGFGLAGFVLAFGLAVPIGPDTYELAYVGLTSGLDTESTYQLVVAAEAIPAATFGVAGLLGLLGVVVVGIALVRGRSAPVWAAAALIVGALAIPPTWFSGSSVAGAAAWLLLSAGFARTAIALVTRNEPATD